MRKLSMAGAVVALIAALTIPAASAAPADQLFARMSGAKEVPEPGDPNGKGRIDVTLKKQKRKVCFALEFERIEDPTEGHIHKGPKDGTGPVKIRLFRDSEGLPGPTAEGCVRDVRRKTLRTLSRHPDRFYVNLHNDDYPDGAIRGQLKATQ